MTLTIIAEMSIKKPSEAQIDRRHRELWDAAIKEHGTAYRVPKDITRDIGEEIRAMHVLAIAWDGSGSPHSVLRTYGVLPHILAKIAGEDERPARVEKRKDKYAKLIELSRANVYTEFTTDQLVEHSGLSRATVTSWVKSTGYFRQVPDKRGRWEARDPAEDRRAEG